MAKQEIHYNLDPIDSLGARFNIIYGERSNGKSYQVKHKPGVEKYLKTGRRFIYLRRKKEELTTEKIERYFSDVDVFKLTNGKYNCISVYKRELYLSVFDFETAKTKPYEKIGYIMNLSTEQNYAGCSYLDVDDIIFEEFMSRDTYLYQESDKLMNLVSTVDRKRNIVRVWMVGNSISRVCPYIHDWGLQDIVSTIKQGEIRTLDLPAGYDKDGNELTVKLAIEHCRSTGESSYAIGRHAAMINTGSWQTDPQPHLPKSIKNYKTLLRVAFIFQDFKFIGKYIMDPTTRDCCWFVFPYRGEVDNKTLVVSDQTQVSRYWIGDIYNSRLPNQKLDLVLKSFVDSKVFYSTDLCGTDFKQVINFTMRK